MKLIIQIPSYNEAETLPITLSALPRKIEGFDSVEILIIDDGSTDNTAEVAKTHGANHIVRFLKHQGLASAFKAGIDTSLQLGADVIVNTDADNQYNADDIPRLVRPILEKRADIVIGTRPINEMRHFSLAKKFLQKTGSWIVRKVSGTDVPDATSGFRAFSREAAMRINIFNEYTYTLETIIQAGQKNMAITSMPVRVNEKLRPSRLIKDTPDYLKRSFFTVIRIFVVYKPFSFFMAIGIGIFTIGVLFGIRFLYYLFTGGGRGHIQSVILGGVCLIVGFQTALVAFLADLLAVNRKLLEEIQYRLKARR